MGWFEYKETNLLLGDKALDLTHSYLKKLSATYMDELGRLPTAGELEALLKVELPLADESFLDEFENKRIIDVKFKIAKRKRYQPFAVGDVFAIPLPKTGYAFGRIVSISPIQKLVLLEVFNYHSKSKRYTPDIVTSGHLVNYFVETGNFFKEWRWEVVENDKNGLEQDISRIKLVTGGKGQYYLITGDMIDYFNRDNPISDQEAEAYGRIALSVPEWYEEEFEKTLIKKGTKLNK